MTPKANRTDHSPEVQPPPEIPAEDWAATPVSIRRLVVLLLESNAKRLARPINHLSNPVLILLNLVVIGALTLLLMDKVVLQCVTPPLISALSVAIIVIMFFHLIWRNIYVLFPPSTISHSGEVVEVGIFRLSFQMLISIIHEFHPWRLSSRQLGALVVILIVALAFLNLSPISPFRPGTQTLAIQSFVIERLTSPTPERLAPGQTLTMASGERVIVEIVFLSEVEASCTWFNATGNQNAKTGCSIALDAPSATGRDVVTVLAQSACGTRQEFASLHVVEQP